MNRLTLPLCAALLLVMLVVPGCSRQATVEPSEPSKVTPVKGTDYNEIVLTDVAMKNLGIQTAAVTSENATATGRASASGGLVMSASALVFNPQGLAFTYTSPSPRTYVRALVAIKRYRGDEVVLTSGPPPGTQVVTVGAPELLGIEYGVGEE